MNAEPSFKLVKKGERKGAEPQAEVKCTVDLNRWSTAVQSWVREFQSIVAPDRCQLSTACSNDGTASQLACSTMRSESEFWPSL